MIDVQRSHNFIKWCSYLTVRQNKFIQISAGRCGRGRPVVVPRPSSWPVDAAFVELRDVGDLRHRSRWPRPSRQRRFRSDPHPDRGDPQRLQRGVVVLSRQPDPRRRSQRPHWRLRVVTPLHLIITNVNQNNMQAPPVASHWPHNRAMMRSRKIFPVSHMNLIIVASLLSFGQWPGGRNKMQCSFFPTCKFSVVICINTT